MNAKLNQSANNGKTVVENIVITKEGRAYGWQVADKGGYCATLSDAINDASLCAKQHGMNVVMVYDNGGKTADRYTAIFPTFEMERNGGFYALSFNDEPFHPQGIGQHCTAWAGRHLGNLIAFESLNADCQKLIAREFQS